MRGLTVLLRPFCCRAARAKSLPGSRVLSECNIDKKSVTREACVDCYISVIQCWYYCPKFFISILKLFRANNPVNIILWQQTPRHCDTQNCTIRLSMNSPISDWKWNSVYAKEASKSLTTLFSFHFCTDAFFPVFSFFFFSQSRVAIRCNKSRRQYTFNVVWARIL